MAAQGQTSDPDKPYPPNAPDGPPYHMWPVRRIIQVGWGFPVYVSVYVTADRTGASSSPAHTQTVTLSPLAVTKGCEIVLTQNIQAGSPYNTMFGITVIKVPTLVKGKLFTLTLAGMAHEQPGAAPDDYFCGTYTSSWSVVRGEDAPLTPGYTGPDRVATYVYTWSWSNPAGSDSGTENIAYFYRLDLPESVAAAAALVGSENEISEYLSYYDGSRLVNTFRSCDDVPDDSSHIALFPFGDVSVTVNPVKDHTVALADEPFIEPAFCVRTVAQTGDKTSIWEIFLERDDQPSISNGLYDGTYDFSMQVSQFATSRTEKIIEIWPSNSSSPVVRYNDVGFRLNKVTPSEFLYNLNWSGNPLFSANLVELIAGSPPPPVTYIPAEIPF